MTIDTSGDQGSINDLSRGCRPPRVGERLLSTPYTSRCQVKCLANLRGVSRTPLQEARLTRSDVAMRLKKKVNYSLPWILA